MRAARIDQTARPKFTSVYPCSWSSLFQAMLSQMNFRPSMMVGSVATFLGRISMIRISVGLSERSRDRKDAVDSELTSSAGLLTFSPWRMSPARVAGVARYRRDPSSLGRPMRNREFLLSDV